MIFVHSNSISYKIINESNKIAEDVLVSFGIVDIDKDTSKGPVPIPSINYDYVNKNSSKGPFAWFSQFAIKNHRYFGIVYVGCKGGSQLRTYWIYGEHGMPGISYFAERNKNDTYEINATKLKENTEKYLLYLVPNNRRIYIK